MDLRDDMESKIITDGIIKAVKINNVPGNFWDEFKKDAEENFSNNYIMKIMIDHYRRIDGDKRVEELINVVGLIEDRLHELENKNVLEEEQKNEKNTETIIKSFGKRGE